MGSRRVAGSLALVGGGEWGPARRELRRRAARRRAAPTRWSCCRPRPPTSTPSGWASGPRPTSTTSARRSAPCRCCTAPRPRTRTIAEDRARRRSSSTSPTARRCTCGRCSRARPLFEALLAAYHGGGVLAASGAGATLLCDPMVDPRGGAYTVGLGVVQNLAVFPYHGTAADHLRERSIDLLPQRRRARRRSTRRPRSSAVRRVDRRGCRRGHALRRDGRPPTRR